VVAYTRQTSAPRGTVDSLLDSASYGARWVLLSPATAARACRTAPAPTHDFGFGLCLVTARADIDGLTRAQPLDAELRQSRLPAPLLGV
jgi:hypothetical protein